jgi:hypothetical protein
MHAPALPSRLSIIQALAVATGLCVVLALRVYTTFDPVRLKLVETPITAVGAAVHVIADERMERFTTTAPLAVIARLSHDSLEVGLFEIHIDGRVVCRPRVRPGAPRRVDCAWPGESSPSHAQVTVTGPPSVWTLDYLELATHHGATREHDLLIVPAISHRYTRPTAGWIVFTWVVMAMTWLIPAPAPLPRWVRALYAAVATLVLGLLSAVLISSLVSSFTVLLSARGFVRAAGVLLLPQLVAAGVRLAGWSRERLATPGDSRRGIPILVLVISGVLGFRVGLVGFPSWHVAVETAQVTAGLVTYPPDNPFFIYHVQLWTGLHQVLAVLLRLGVSELALSVILSGVLGMVSVQALSMVVYAMSRDASLAIAAAFLLFYAGVGEAGVIYPIALMGTTHTYGALGLSWIVLVAGLLGAGCRRTGSFFLGIAPAVHPSIGLWFALVVVLAAVRDVRCFRVPRAVDARFLLAGGALSLASLAVHLSLAADVLPTVSDQAARYVTTFVSLWDGHRAPVSFQSTGVALTVGVLGLALLWSTTFARDVPAPAAFLLRIVGVGAALSLGLAGLSHVPPTTLPATVMVLMPGRMLNFSAMVAPALILGLIGAYRRTAWGGWVALLVTAGVLFNDRSRLWIWEADHLLARWSSLWRTEMLLVLGLASMALIAGAWLAPRRERAWSGAVASNAAIAIMGWAFIQTWQVSVHGREILLDRTNDTVLSAAGGGTGILATAGDLHLVQLRTRRPVLLDGGGLDGLPYAPAGAGAMVQILDDVYGIDFFSPPEEARGSGTIPRRSNRTAWEGYSSEKWTQVRRTYGVTQVLAYADWRLALPVVARDPTHVLYRIP